MKFPELWEIITGFLKPSDGRKDKGKKWWRQKYQGAATGLKGMLAHSGLVLNSSNDPVGHPGITQMINRIMSDAVLTKGKYQLNKTVHVSIDIYLLVRGVLSCSFNVEWWRLLYKSTKSSSRLLHTCASGSIQTHKCATTSGMFVCRKPKN